ncbi:MAG: hypothetical protein Q4P71_03555 [Actinomycetaceae bacterium]|nr:hypothetical protein [Actinomycetaceae bacterium]
MKIPKGITSLTGQPIKAGTTLTWTLTCDSSDVGGSAWFSAPSVVNTSEDWLVTRQTHTGEWYMSQQGFVRFTWTAVRDILPGNLECNDHAPLVDFSRLPSRTQITISVNDVENGTANVIGGTDGTLVFRAPRRFSGSYVNHYDNRALRFIDKTGTVTCFPPVTYSYNITSNDPICAEIASNDSSTIYPDGTCVHEEWTSGEITLPTRC